MLSLCLSLGLDLQTLYMAWQDDTKIHRHTISEISCATQISKLSLVLIEVFSGLRDPTTSDQYLFYLALA